VGIMENIIYMNSHNLSQMIQVHGPIPYGDIAVVIDDSLPNGFMRANDGEPVNMALIYPDFLIES